jgi:CBS-domain-containing membrane protein
MSKRVNYLNNVDTVSNIMTALKTKHHTFPILNVHGNIVGLMPRNFIMVLLKNQAFYNHDVG